MSKTKLVFSLMIAAAGLALVLALAVPAKAITFGEPDVENVYSNVGTMVGNLPLGSHQWTCSGTLIAPTVYLTAGHCAAVMEAWIASGVITLEDVKISFSPTNVLDQSTWLDIAGFAIHPLYGTAGDAANTYDIGLAILAEPVDLPLVNLPPEGFLDDLKDAGVLVGGVDRSELLVVGYGDTIIWPQFEVLISDGGRWYTNSGFLTINHPWIILSGNHNLGYGGMCAGDSGGPTFIEYEGKLWQVGVHSHTGSCIGSTFDYRLDTTDSLDFIAPYLEP